ncbi:MAG: hypothetical protein ABIO70_33815 [Pseudomonadota bacterium]
MLSDRHRWLKLLVPIVALVALCAWYAWRASTIAVGYARCMADPAAHDGEVLELSLWSVDEVQADRYLISRTEQGVPVIAPTAGLAPGQTVSVVARFDANAAALMEQHREIHHLRRAKYALGILGMALFLGYVAWHFRWRAGRLTLRA